MSPGSGICNFAGSGPFKKTKTKKNSILQNMTRRTAFHGCINIEGANEKKRTDGLPASLTLEPMIEFGKRQRRSGGG